MTARAVGKKKTTTTTPSKRGGRRVVARASLAGRKRRGGASVGRYASPKPIELVGMKKPPAPQKPRPVRPQMRALMAGEWKEEPRPFTAAERKAAQRAVDFFETKLRHFEGKHAGKPFLLELWQEALIRRLFGRLNKDGTRQYREAYIELGRKNGKSTLAAGIALCLLDEGEPGAQVFSAAGDRAQARIVFRTASQMVLQSPALMEKLAKPFKNEIISLDETCFYRVLSADADSQHGLNPHGVVLDEVHTQPNRELYDVLKSASGAREQPLIVSITTAGFDRNSICWELHEYARKILDGTLVDPTFLAILYSADILDDWTSPKTWAKANPNLGVSVKLEYLEAQCEKAKVTPAYENTFRRLYLSQWTSQETRFLPMERWDSCDVALDLEKLRGRACFAGLDLSSTLDVTAFVLVFPDTDGTFDVLPFFFLPRHAISERSKRDGVPYDEWSAQSLNGFPILHLTDGEVIDYAFVRAFILEMAKQFDIREIAFDSWNATSITQELETMGQTVLPFGQGWRSMTNPTKELLAKVISKKIRHGGHPLLRWMAECVTVAHDPAGNLKPVKPDRRTNATRIDGIVAMIMGLERAMRHQASQIGGPRGTSIYQTRGLRSL